MKILIIEKCPDIIGTIKLYLDDIYELICCENFFNTEKLIQEKKPDIILLDISIPDLNSINLCNLIKKNPNKYGHPYIIVLSLEKTLNSVAEAFRYGADDYIKKPFDFQELILRVKKFKMQIKSHKKEIKYKDFIINTYKQLIYYKDQELPLTKKEFMLMSFFIQNRGIVLSREKIINKLWLDSEVELSAVDQCIKRLRKKVPDLKKIIETRRGFGFKFN